MATQWYEVGRVVQSTNRRGQNFLGRLPISYNPFNVLTPGTKLVHG